MAVCVAVETGLLASEVLSTLPKPTSPLTNPVGEVIDAPVGIITVPVNVGEVIGALASNAICKPLVLAIDNAASAIAVAFPVLVTTPVKFALVTTVVALPLEVTIPVKFALVVLAAATKAVVASAVVLSPAVWVTPMVPVGKVGVPVNVGEAIVAFSANASNTAF